MNLSTINIDIENFRRPLPYPSNFESAIYRLMDKYSFININNKVKESIDFDVSEINCRFNKNLKFEINYKSGKIIFSGEEINLPLTREILFEKY